MIKSLEIKNYKGFGDTTIDFSDITCIIGENSTGKSTIINALTEVLTDKQYGGTPRISPELLKSGINDMNSMSLCLNFPGRKIVRTAQKSEGFDEKIVPALIDNISPISPKYNLNVDPNHADYNKPMKDQKFSRDKAWENIFSKCDTTLDGVDYLSNNNMSTLNDNILTPISSVFTDCFNHNFSLILEREYEFKINFVKDAGSLVGKMSARYKMSNNDKMAPYVDLENESPGFRILMTICSYLFNSDNRNKSGFLLLVDEPFTGIHPKAQLHLNEIFNSLSDKIQIIYATHCQHLLPDDKEKIVCTLAKSAGDLSTCSYHEYHLNRFYEHSPIVLDIIEKISSNKENHIIVFVEGKTDKNIYEKYFQLKEVSKITSVIDMKGGSNKNIWKMIAESDLDKPFLFILDPNERHDKMESFRKTIEERSNTYLVELCFQENNHIKTGVENLMPNEIIQKAFEQNIGDIQKVTKETFGTPPLIEYEVKKDGGGKDKLANFFIQNASDENYVFFEQVMNEINQICEDFNLENPAKNNDTNNGKS